MGSKTLVIGIPPRYDYPGKLEEWSQSNTLYAANLGACLITNSILRQFDGHYTKDFSNIDVLNQSFDRCILAFATHIHPDRDISLFTEVVEQLEMPTYFISGGITDYAQDTNLDYTIHPSVKRLLQIVQSRSEWIGVRGHYTASVLARQGFKNVLPIGCPSMFWNLDGPLTIEKRDRIPEKILIPYHLTLSSQIPDWEPETTLLGQDFQDHLAFTNELNDDARLQRWFRNQFESDSEFERMNQRIQNHGIWTREFEKWLYTIGEYDFVVGPRLHGCVAGLIQRIPTAMTTRDLRGREIAEFFDIPSFDYENLKSKSAAEIYNSISFEKFNRTHQLRYQNYLQFLKENNLRSRHQQSKQDRPYTFSAKDIVVRDFIATQFANAVLDRADENDRKIDKRAKLIEKVARRFTAETVNS